MTGSLLDPDRCPRRCLGAAETLTVLAECHAIDQSPYAASSMKAHTRGLGLSLTPFGNGTGLKASYELMTLNSTEHTHGAFERGTFRGAGWPSSTLDGG